MYPGNMRNKSRIMCLAYLRETVVSFRANEPQLKTHLHAKDGSRLDFLGMLPPIPLLFSSMNRKSDKAYRREDATFVEYYIAYLLLILEYARIWPAESFSPLKILISMGATIIFILANFLLVISEMVALTMNNDLKLFVSIIGAICMHIVGLIKWCYCIQKNRKIVNIVGKLEKCHVLCQRIDNSKEGTSIIYYCSVIYLCFSL